MHFAEELVSPKSLQIPGDIAIGSREMRMAIELIDRLSDSWAPDKYTDDYRHAVMDLIQKKVESGGRTPAGAKGPSRRSATKVIDLVSVLQQSLQKTGRGAPARKTTRARRSRRVLAKAA
jgi:DNA end-binding protein Ku